MKTFPLSILITALAVSAPSAQELQVLRHQKINQFHGGLGIDLARADSFGSDLANIGDLDGDGLDELAVGVPGRQNDGQVWILFLEPTGRVRDVVPIANPERQPQRDYRFGMRVEGLGDLDGNGAGDLIVSCTNTADEAQLCILFLDANADVLGHRMLGADELDVDGAPGAAGIAVLGDLSGDGTLELALGAPTFDGKSGIDIVSLTAAGDPVASLHISAGVGGFTGALDDADWFGFGPEAIGDLDGDGITELAVPSILDVDGGAGAGAVWILFLEPDATVRGQTKISALEGDQALPIETGDLFGSSLVGIGDRNHDGIPDLAVGATGDDATRVFGGDNQDNKGAVWILYLGANGAVLDRDVISEAEGGLRTQFRANAYFGSEIADLGDLDGDGFGELAVVSNDGDGYHGADLGTFLRDRGAIYVLFTGDEASPLPPLIEPYGADPEISGSDRRFRRDGLRVLRGQPRVGGRLQVGVDNLYGTQGPGGIAVLGISLAPAQLPFPGAQGMLPASEADLLISLAPTDLLWELPKGPWMGPGRPLTYNLRVPNIPALVGASVYLQAALEDPSSGAAVPMALTNGLELRIGS